MDTKVILVVYQHLFARFCIQNKYTKIYKTNEEAIPTLIRSFLYPGGQK
jgi:hypothetical protein